MESLKKCYHVLREVIQTRKALAWWVLLCYNLHIEKLGEREFAVDGTPTDAVTIAVGKLLPRQPKLVVSGINREENLGEDVSYSGTVSAAMEGVLMGIPSIAFSLVGRKDFDFTASAKFATKLSRLVLKNGLPSDTLLNVNIPHTKNIKGARITKQGKRSYGGDTVIEKTDPRGKKYYWIAGEPINDADVGTDVHTVRVHKRISITPLKLDFTSIESIDDLDVLKTL